MKRSFGWFLLILLFGCTSAPALTATLAPTARIVWRSNSYWVPNLEMYLNWLTKSW